MAWCEHRATENACCGVAMARRGAAAKGSEEMPSGIVLLLLKVSALVSVVRMLYGGAKRSLVGKCVFMHLELS